MTPEDTKKHAELERQIWKLRKEANDIRDKYTEQEAAALVGKCYKMRNNYGGASSENWWLYVLVYKSDGSVPYVLTAEIDCYGMAEIKEQSYSATMLTEPNNGYIKIPFGEFKKALAKTMAAIETACPGYFGK